MSILIAKDEVYQAVIDNTELFCNEYQTPKKYCMKKVVNDLRAAAIRSYECRYENKKKEEVVIQPIVSGEYKKLTVVHLLKLMQFIHYQPESEHMTWEEKESSKVMEQWIQSLTSVIMRKNTNYDEVPWGRI